MSDPGKNIIGRFAAVYIFIIVLMLLVVYNIFKIQVIEGKNWLELGAKNDKKDITVPPNRGNIYSADGRLMASSIPTYYVYMDTRVDALHEKGGKLFKENIDSLSQYLSDYFGDKSAGEYKLGFKNAYNRGMAEYPFIKRRISFSELKNLKKFPLFKLGRYKSGLLSKEQFRRVKPFSTLASRTIGDIYADESKGGKNGLELGFDTILKGTPGVSGMRKIANRWEEIVDVEPVDGMDITTTIDVDMQDIAEKALLDKIKEINAETGYAILMEAKTGEIKAIVNMQRNADGTYSENQNGVVSDKVEPGSVFKVMSLMAVLDDGKAKLSDIVETGNGTWKVANAIMKDHNYKSGGYGALTLEHALNASSNIGISKTIVKAYGDNPAAYVSKLYKMGINKPFDLHIPGTATPNIRYPNKDSWYATTLAWMSTGYEIQIPPIYTVAYFNSIANNGKYVEPLLIKSISKNGQVVKEFQARVINEQICKPSTLQDIRRALLGVVENPKYATGKLVRSKYVRIGGKTGTAQISKGAGGYKTGGTSHQVSFCGIFPFDNPQYTCLVVFREPSSKLSPSGGGMAGPVVKNIAERITAIQSKMTVKTMPEDSTVMNTRKPYVKGGKYDSFRSAMYGLKQNVKTPSAKWIQTECDGKDISAKSLAISDSKVPNLYGMGAKDAVYLCQSLGLKVNFSGKGKVYSQSLPSGTQAVKGYTINLMLQ